MRKTLIFALALIALLLCASCSQSGYDTDAIRNSVVWQMERYPQSTLKDLYKAFFQDAFGPGHLMSKAENATDSMKNYLLRECEVAKSDVSVCELYEKTGWHGRFYRVDLSVINEGIIPFDVFLNAFLESAESFSLPDLDQWKQEWAVIEGEIHKMYPDLPGYEADKAGIDELLESGHYASHHSEEYNKAYHPHYRLIEKGIFEKEIIPYIKDYNSTKEI